MAKRGDVMLVPFPDTNGLTVRVRPALVVQADDLNTGIGQILVAAITSNRARSGAVYRLTLPVNSPEGTQAGVLTDSVVMLDNLATVPLDAVGRVIGTVSLSDIESGLRAVFGLL